MYVIISVYQYLYPITFFLAHGMSSVSIFFQLHQFSPFFVSLWDILISFRLGLCSLSNHSMQLPFQWNKVHCLHCTPHPFPMIWKSQSFMELVRNIRAFLSYSFWIVFYRMHPYFWVLIFSLAEYQGSKPFFETCYKYISKLWNPSYCHWFTSWCHSTIWWQSWYLVQGHHWYYSK